MIERVVLHQSRFRSPGLVPDARGVALGPLGVVLLSSPERLVSFLRAAGEEGALDELLDSLRILQVVSPLRTREMIVEVQSSSSHRMDRLAAIARLLGGVVFTGAGRHFVKYRDAQAPFGYDAGELLADPGDLALYQERSAQAYKIARTIAIRDLILRLSPMQVPRARAEVPRVLYALVHFGLGESVIGYLARWAVSARVAVVEWQRGGTSDQIERAYLLQLTSPAQRFVQLLRSLPGVSLFVPDGERTAVEFGFRHPVPLSACSPLFASDEMVLFRARGAGAVVLAQRPPFVDVQTVATFASSTDTPTQQVRALSVNVSFALPLTLVTSSAPPRRVSAVMIPTKQQDVLGRMLSVLPASALSRLTAAFTEHSIYLYGPDSAHTIPLGTLYEEIGEDVFTPLGSSVSPPVPPNVIRQLARAESGTRLFITGGRYPITAVPVSAFVAATLLLVADVPVFEDALVAPPLDAVRELPDIWPEPPGTLAAITTPGARGNLPPPRNPLAEIESPESTEDESGDPGTPDEGASG